MVTRVEPAELRLLSELLGVPDAGALALLQDAAAHWPWLAAPLAELAQMPLDRWQGEHTRLFIAGYPRTPCPPFASSWAERRMHGSAMEALSRFYAELGLETTHMPADFLGTILECAALLAQEDAGGEMQARLWREHLLPWLPEFTAALARESTVGIYRVLAQRLDAAIHEQRLATTAAGAA